MGCLTQRPRTIIPNPSKTKCICYYSPVLWCPRFSCVLYEYMCVWLHLAHTERIPAAPVVVHNRIRTRQNVSDLIVNRPSSSTESILFPVKTHKWAERINTRVGWNTQKKLTWPSRRGDDGDTMTDIVGEIINGGGARDARELVRLTNCLDRTRPMVCMEGLRAAIRTRRRPTKEFRGVWGGGSVVDWRRQNCSAMRWVWCDL